MNRIRIIWSICIGLIMGLLAVLLFGGGRNKNVLPGTFWSTESAKSASFSDKDVERFSDSALTGVAKLHEFNDTRKYGYDAKRFIDSMCYYKNANLRRWQEKHHEHLQFIDYGIIDSLEWYKEAYQHQAVMHYALQTVFANIPYPLLENIKDSGFNNAQEKYFSLQKKYSAWQLSH